MNDVTLRELIESEIRRVEAQIDSLETSVNKSERILGERLEGIPSQMATKEQLVYLQDRIETRLRSLEDQRTYITGIAATVAVLISLLGLVVRYIFI